MRTKKCFLLIVSIAIVELCNAQVGINIKSPQGILHIDPKSDTNGAANTSDDVVATSTGRLGIGTSNPISALDIRGALRIADGSEGSDKVFTAINSQGLGKWVEADLKSKIGLWSIVNSTVNYYATSAEVILMDEQATPNTLKNDEIALVALDNYRLKIPVGKYMVFINQDISYAEYGTYSIKNYQDNSIIYQQVYAEWLSGASFILDIAADLTIYITWKPVDRHTASNGYYNEIGGPVKRALGKSSLTFLSLK